MSKEIVKKEKCGCKSYIEDKMQCIYLCKKHRYNETEGRRIFLMLINSFSRPSWEQYDDGRSVYVKMINMVQDRVGK